MAFKIDTEKLGSCLGVTVRKSDLYQEALTHRSFLNEHRDYPYPHNERLEFLGDAVLELAVTRHLFDTLPNPEGELTAFRAALVNGDMLSHIGRELGIDEFLLMSRGESKDTGRARSYLIANAVEAVIGAIYLDLGYDAAAEFIGRVVLTRLPEVMEKGLYTDPKSRFQEMAQEKTGITPNYGILRESGPDHNRTFVAGVFLEDELIAEGEGTSKQEAQREAAKKGLEKKGW